MLPHPRPPPQSPSLNKEGEGKRKGKTKTMETKIHIGSLIEKKMREKGLTKKQLGGMTGIKPVTIRYYLKRETLDVVTVHKIGKALKFNFFSYFPVTEDSSGLVVVSSEKEKEIEKIKSDGAEEKKKLLEKIVALEKELDNAKRELVMMKQENGFLKEINELLKKK